MGDAAASLLPTTTEKFSEKLPNVSETSSETYKMPGWQIGVIILSIILAVVVVYKLYKHLTTKGLRLSCCVEGNRGQNKSGLHRAGTAQPLMRSESGSSADGDKDGQEGRSEMV